MPARPRRATMRATCLAVALLAAACSDDGGSIESVGPGADGDTTAPAPPAGAVGTTAPGAEPPGELGAAEGGPDTTPSTAQTAPPGPVPARAPDALAAIPDDPAALAAELVEVEQAIRDPATPPDDLPELGHRQQLAYRVLARNPAWDEQVIGSVPESLRAVVARNTSAPREALGMFGRLATKLPAWRIVEPEPPEALLGYYREAEAATGVDWEVLAAINLVETGMGRIQGLSSAGAQGPMQFIPSTWERWGEGDVTVPSDAIAAAARYLADRGAPADYDAAIWAYNNHVNYVRAVTAYAEVMRADERAFLGYYHWQIQYYAEAGDLWLRVGYDEPEPIDAAAWAAANPTMVAGPPPPLELLDR